MDAYALGAQYRDDWHGLASAISRYLFAAKNENRNIVHGPVIDALEQCRADEQKLNRAAIAKAEGKA
jgi:DNA-binding ferritin-like protein (Dps family)